MEQIQYLCGTLTHMYGGGGIHPQSPIYNVTRIQWTSWIILSQVNIKSEISYWKPTYTI